MPPHPFLFCTRCVVATAVPFHFCAISCILALIRRELPFILRPSLPPPVCLLSLCYDFYFYFFLRVPLFFSPNSMAGSVITYVDACVQCRASITLIVSLSFLFSFSLFFFPSLSRLSIDYIAWKIMVNCSAYVTELKTVFENNLRAFCKIFYFFPISKLRARDTDKSHSCMEKQMPSKLN